MSKANDLRIAAINRHRKRLFGDSSLKVYSITPAEGEAVVETFAKDWMGQRTDAITTSGGTGAWQFQVVAKANWVATQEFMKSIVALTIGTRRWKITKIEEPIGESLVWKIRAEVEK